MIEEIFEYEEMNIFSINDMNENIFWIFFEYIKRNYYKLLYRMMRYI